ncbi:hypothetical protein MCC93_21980 [Morococcus cerebrosus]|uniref:Uncharacterized protein n=1 Tax=Morococcus cerebrosus TaxID=1056807 RepID=A0A0C1GLH5_9NEIS|nr:hypothetical protein MCC93_21980 [Morococcus cerebrosus]
MKKGRLKTGKQVFRRPLNMIRMLNYRCLLLFYVLNKTRLRKVWGIY